MPTVLQSTCKRAGWDAVRPGFKTSSQTQQGQCSICVQSGISEVASLAEGVQALHHAEKAVLVRPDVPGVSDSRQPPPAHCEIQKCINLFMNVIRLMGLALGPQMPPLDVEGVRK